jgi:hypothetical protein
LLAVRLKKRHKRRCIPRGFHGSPVSDTLIAAIISVVAIAILAPLANHFITKYRDRRSLRASLSVHESPLPVLLETYLKELRYKPEAGPFNPQQLDVLSFLRGYMKLTLHNPSKKKLNAVTVTLTDILGEPLHQIEDQPELRGPTEKKILLGDLQPHQSRTLHIWTRSSYVDWHHTRLPMLFEITADEFDKRTLKLPMPNYLKSLLHRRASWCVMWTSIGIAVATWLFVLISGNVLR